MALIAQVLLFVEQVAQVTRLLEIFVQVLALLGFNVG